MLSEEEIIGMIKPISNCFKTYEDNYLMSKNLTYMQLKAVNGLLDLYNKQKDKIKELEMKHSLELIGKEEEIKANMSEIIEHYYISKDKIREIIEKRINRLEAERDDNLDYSSDYDYEIVLLGEIEQELLGEEKQ